MDENLRKAALEYHRQGRPGKLSITPTKQLSNQYDLSLAYSPGVAAACLEIQKDPKTSVEYTSRGNLVAVISNGTAVLGLGDIGALAGKPVMEGKAVLFKKFSGIDVFDIEINEKDPEKLVQIIKSLEPTFGGINLEDIKAPECFYIEEKLRESMNIPVFHDDQHGTAVTVVAAFTNGLKVVDKDIKDVKVVTSGAGAAAIACLKLLVRSGLPKENIWLCDHSGVVYEGREKDANNPLKREFAQPTDKRTLADAIEGADVFLGLSVGKVLTPEMLLKMNDKPLVLALANPEPEILPDLAYATRPDVVVATGRSDYPNQVNNVLCFPYIFRGALDVGATTITTKMELAAVKAICDLAHEGQQQQQPGADQPLDPFGPKYFIPRPFDNRLLVHIAPAVAQAAMEDGVATRPIEDMEAYKAKLQEFVYNSGAFMKPIYAAAKKCVLAERKSRIVYAEGEERTVLQAVQDVVKLKLAKPIVIGRPEVIQKRIKEYSLHLDLEAIEIVNPDSDERYKDYWTEYWNLMKRKGVTPQIARLEMRRRNTLIGAMMVRMGHADGLICGLVGSFKKHLKYIDNVLDREPDANVYAAMNIICTPERAIALADTHINPNPTAEEVAEITLKAAQEMRYLNIKPKVALLSASNYGTDAALGGKMSRALELVRAADPTLEVDGEMHGDLALNEMMRQEIMPDSPLKGSANLLIFPDMTSGNISYNLLRSMRSTNVAIGPFLLGVDAPAYILTTASTPRRIINMTAVAVVVANNAMSEV